MILVQQGHNNMLAAQQQQQQQQAWQQQQQQAAALQQASNNNIMQAQLAAQLRGMQPAGMAQAQAQQHPHQPAMYPQQVRMTPVSTVTAAQLPPQMMMMAPTGAAPPRQPAAGHMLVVNNNNPAAAAPAAAPDSGKQMVYVNVNGTMQRAILQNGAVYLLANDAPAAATAPQQTAGMHPQLTAGNNGQVLALQPATAQQQQQQVVMQHVLPNGQLVSAALVAAPHAGLQQQLPMQAQQQPQMQAVRPVPAGVGLAATPQQVQQQQQAVVLMAPTKNMTAARVAAMPANPGSPGAGAGNMQARVLQPQQQQVLVQLPQGMAAHGAAAQRTVALRPAGQHFTGPLRPPGAANAAQTTNMPAHSVSANTASLMPRVAAGPQALPPAAAAGGASGPPMTIAAALAALPSNPSAATTAGAPGSSELSSPVVPPGTPGMANAALVMGGANGTIGAVISKLGDPQVRGGAAVGSAGRTSVTPTGSSPLTSQPGTPSRSNSVGTNSSSSSSSGGTGAASDSSSSSEGKMAVMRMFARTFIETGIGLEQALCMIQPADRDMLAAAFAAEAAAATLEANTGGPAQMAQPAAAGGAAGGTSPKNGLLAELGGEQITMPPASDRRPSGQSGLLQLSNTAPGAAAFEGAQVAAPGLDTSNLGAWGFSLFSSVGGSDFGSNQGSSLGGTGQAGNNAAASSEDMSRGAPSTTDDVSTATLFANLNL